MMDKRKKGRKNKPDHSLETDLVREYLRIKASQRAHACYCLFKYGERVPTVHLLLARKFKIPCNQVRTILQQNVEGYRWKGPDEYSRLEDVVCNCGWCV